jgi:hypothetical protein
VVCCSKRMNLWCRLFDGDSKSSSGTAKRRVIPDFSGGSDDDEEYLDQARPGDVEAGAANADSNSDTNDNPLQEDDFHSPLKPSDYIELRLGRQLQFYQQRMPRYSRFYTLAQGLLIISAGIGACMSFFGYARYVAIVSVCSTSITAYVEFNSTSRKLARYNQVVSRLFGHLEWWKSLTLIETVDRANISHLVTEAERTFMGEVNGWISRPATGRLSDGGLSNPTSDGKSTLEGSQNGGGGSKINDGRGQ